MMENNPEQVKIMIETDEEIDEDVMASSSQYLDATMFFSDDKCCIYTVPEYVRKGKEECYRPLVASIGPVFYNKDPKLETMQQLKQKLLKCFLEHPDNAKTMQEPYVEFVSQLERKIRECYEERINIPSDEFIQLIVLDAAFFFLLLSKRDDRPSCNTKMSIPERKLVVALDYLGRDLFMVENQLPFFVLNGMYNIAFGHINSRVPFTHLALECMDYGFPGPLAIKSIMDGQKITDDDASSIRHLVHLRRECCCLPFRERRQNKGQALLGDFHEFQSAKQLSDAGVKFKSIDIDDPFDITLEKPTGVLRIPKLTFYDSTEAALRSILFSEQYHYENKYFADLFIFLDKLIDTVEDIKILQHKEIINNHLGSDEDAKDLFNNLTKNVLWSPSSFAFWDVSGDLKEYASKPWNRWKAIFWSRYFNHPWAIISVVAAAILIILSILQTITGFLQIHK